MSDQKPKTVPAFVKNNIAGKNFHSTVGSVIRHVLPNGTHGSQQEWANCPKEPENVFAVCGYLLEQSGALSFFGAGEDKPYKEYPRLFLKDTDAKLLASIAKTWNGSPNSVPKSVERLWATLYSFRDFPLSYRAFRFPSPRKFNDQYWWKLAYKLFTVADNACEGIGFLPFDENERTIASEFWEKRIILHREINNDKISQNRGFEVHSSIALKADPDVVCVQPKSLVPTVGSGTRVFSRNLALLRSRGVVRTQWIIQNSLRQVSDQKGLNILIIPFPYEYDRSEFTIKEIKDESLRKVTSVFEPKQTWLRSEAYSEFKSQVNLFIERCKNSYDESIHGIVLPELAMNQEVFLNFAKYAKNLAPSLEFIMTGSSENCEVSPKKGNYIWIRKFLADENGKHSDSDGFIDVSQGKHHRWQLEGSQIRDYGLQAGASDSGFDPQKVYWENFSGRPRELSFVAFRENSVLAGVVCEDLARSEPCHEIIKAVGPNLLLALLMDGPQIDQRWGAKYASLFSEDHGGAVMTVSSRALVDKSQSSRADADKNYSVVYFKSPAMKEAACFPCEEKGSAVFIRLIPSNNSEHRSLIDGRVKECSDWILDPSFTKPHVITV